MPPSCILRSRGTRNTPTDTAQNDVLGYITFKSYASNKWYAAAQIYGTLDQDMPGLGKAGGKIVFATTDINTASTHELVDRVTIDSKGRFMQRSTAKTGVAYHIRASEITTGMALNVQAPNLRSGIGMHITTEIAPEGPHNISLFADDGTLHVAAHVVARFNAGDSVEIHNCTYEANNRRFTIRSSLGNLIHLQSLNGFAPQNLIEEANTTCLLSRPKSIPRMVKRTSKRLIQSLSSNGTIVFPNSDIVLYNAGELVHLDGCEFVTNNGQYIIKDIDTPTNVINLLLRNMKPRTDFVGESTCKLSRPSGRLLHVDASSQRHGTLIDIEAQSLLDGEAVYIKSENLQNDGKGYSFRVEIKFIEPRCKNRRIRSCVWKRSSRERQGYEEWYYVSHFIQRRQLIDRIPNVIPHKKH